MDSELPAIAHASLLPSEGPRWARTAATALHASLLCRSLPDSWAVAVARASSAAAAAHFFVAVGTRCSSWMKPFSVVTPTGWEPLGGIWHTSCSLVVMWKTRCEAAACHPRGNLFHAGSRR
jgi:hypothetical protein